MLLGFADLDSPKVLLHAPECGEQKALESRAFMFTSASRVCCINKLLFASNDFRAGVEGIGAPNLFFGPVRGLKAPVTVRFIEKVLTV